jgi:hypothetical protein
MLGYPQPKEADMPNGVFPVPQFHSYARRTATRSGLVLRMRTRWRRRRLEEELSHGANPAASAELTQRAAQLRSPAARLRLANTLAKTLDEARQPQLWSMKLQPQRAEIRGCADDLLGLVARLRGHDPVHARGMAMTARLMTAGTSRLDPDSGEGLRLAVRAARLALDGPTRTRQDLRAAA